MGNELRELYEKIQQLCEKLSDVDQSIFEEGAVEEELFEWQLQNGVKMPDEYMQWLQMSKYVNICGGLLELFMPSVNGYYGSLVSPEYVVIGNIIGDGERICYSRATGKFVRYDHGTAIKLKDFKDILVWVTEYLEIMLNEKTGRPQYIEQMELLRRQAVQGFWMNERKLISEGMCTRNWNFDEIEGIYNISTETGNQRHYAGKPVIYNQDGNKLVDENGTPVHYEGHHMLSYDENPGYAGEWKNIQALTPREHMLGAHAAR